jgi:hypothetical protein
MKNNATTKFRGNTYTKLHLYATNEAIALHVLQQNKDITATQIISCNIAVPYLLPKFYVAT